MIPVTCREYAAAALGLLLVAGTAQAQSPSDEVLVIINDNSLASQEIGADYVVERSVPAAHVCHVRAPASRHMSFNDYRLLRDFIITDCICPMIDPSSRPGACGTPTPEAIQTEITQFVPRTPIRFVVTTDGLPFFLLYPISCSGTAASIDNNLAYDLVSAQGILRTDGSSCTDGPRTSYYFPKGPPALDPATHAMVAPGRLEADSPALAKQLVRRAMLAEQDGFSGRWHFNRSWASYMDTETAYYSAHAAFLDGDACLPSAVSNYNITPCTATFTQSQIPSATIPLVDAASVYLGSYQNTGFGNWSNFTKWRVDSSCDPGSVDAPNYAWDPLTGEARAGGCVGVLPGFIGNQFGSFTCDKARLAPTYWIGSTASPHQIPRVVDGVANSGSYSLFFGSDDQVASPLPAAAAQRFAVSTSGLVPATVTVFTQGTVAVSVRSDGLSSTRLAVNVTTRFADNSTVNSACSPALPLPDDTAGAWVRLSCSVSNASETRDLSNLSLQLSATDFFGRFYVDDVSFSLPTGEELLTTRNASFEEGQRDAASAGNNGNWCIGWNSLLGATAVFGSVSHWMTNGWSHRHVSTLPGLLSGRLLGELVWGSQSTPGSAVLIGDPIYDPPLAVELRLDVAGGRIDYTTPLTVALFGSARNGRRSDRWSAVSYALSYAAGTDPAVITDWREDGMAFATDGLGGRDDELLGFWDTSTISSGDYIVRLVALVPWGDRNVNDVAAFAAVTIDRRCIPNPCLEPNRSQCVEIDDELVICACDPGCVEDGAGACVDDVCDPNPCAAAHRHCEPSAVGPVCVCDAGFIEVAGECIVDACNPNPCTVPLRRVCTNEEGIAGCSCDPGYVDQGNQCVRDVCSPNPCGAEHQSRCVNDNGNAICLCDGGYQYDSGETCVPVVGPPARPAGVGTGDGCGCRGSPGGGSWRLAFVLAAVAWRRRRQEPARLRPGAHRLAR